MFILSLFSIISKLISVAIWAAAILLIVSYCLLFKKAGFDWWKGLIPIYNSYVMAVEMAGMDVKWFAFQFVPFAGIVASAKITMDALDSFEVSEDLKLVAIFYPMVVFPMVALQDKYQYIGIGD